AQLERALSEYAARHRFGHPGPEELLAVVAEFLGAAAESNLRRALYDGAYVNFELRDLRSAPLPPEPGEPVQFSTRVALHRHGELVFPVDIVMHTSSGERIERHWSAEARSLELTHTGPSPVVSVVVDPARQLLIESDWLDNAVRAEPSSPVATLERVMY